MERTPSLLQAVSHYDKSVELNLFFCSLQNLLSTRMNSKIIFLKINPFNLPVLDAWESTLCFSGSQFKANLKKEILSLSFDKIKVKNNFNKDFLITGKTSTLTQFKFPQNRRFLFPQARKSPK